MNSQSSIRISWEPLRSLAYTSISGTYALIGTPFANPARQLIINNNTDANMIFSWDGVNDYLFIAANTSMILDYCSNKNAMAGTLEQPAGTFAYVKEESASPTKGHIYLSLIYASQA